MGDSGAAQRRPAGIKSGAAHLSHPIEEQAAHPGAGEVQRDCVPVADGGALDLLGHGRRDAAVLPDEVDDLLGFGRSKAANLVLRLSKVGGRAGAFDPGGFGEIGGVRYNNFLSGLSLMCWMAAKDFPLPMMAS